MANCDQCEALTINGVYCHERGCPKAWRDTIRDCIYCGCDFKPQNQFDKTCSEQCQRDYFGMTD